MADMMRSVFYGIQFGTTEAAIVPDSFRTSNEAVLDEVRAGAAYHPYMINVLRKRPGFAFTLLDVSALSEWTEVGTAPIESVSAHWRHIEQGAGVDGAYSSMSMTKGAVMPVSLSADAGSSATLECMAIVAFSNGVGLTEGTEASAHADVSDTWKAESVRIGTDTVLGVESMNCSWQYEVKDDLQLEPVYYGYSGMGISGSATLLEVGRATAAMIEDNAQEEIALTLRGVNSGTAHVISLGKCSISAERSGSNATINWTKLQA